MKRILLIACCVASVASVASCAKSEVVDLNCDNPNIIKFSTYASSLTKGTDTTLDNIGDIGVSAVSAGEALSDDNLTIPNTRLSKSDGVWSSSAAYYWPADGSFYDFYAYYPFSGKNDTSNFESGTTTINAPYTFVISTTAVDQLDIVAGGNRKVTQQSEVLLTLDHMLSKVDFRVGLQSEVSDLAIEMIIFGISLKGINTTTSGLDLATPQMVIPSDVASYFSEVYTYNTQAYDLLVSPSSGSDATVVYNDDNSITINDLAVFGDLLLTEPTDVNMTTSFVDVDASKAVSAFMLLPQELEAGRQQLVLEYTMKQAGIYIVGNENEHQTTAFDLATSTLDEWESGKSYLYSIEFIAANGNLSDAEVIEFYVMSGDWGVSDDLEGSN
ncbi:MAG: fimbrillin family protein [Rikenellaceae bacterium]